MLKARFGFSTGLGSFRCSPECFAGRHRYSTANKFDVVIIGGGVVGATLAATLASHPAAADQRIAVIDSGDLTKLSIYNPPTDIWSNRVVSMTPRSASVLEQIGVWPPDKLKAYSRIQVWDALSSARLGFSSTELLLDTPLAYMVELPLIHARLLKSLRSLADVNSDVSIFDRSKVTSISRSATTNWPIVNLTTANGPASIEARLLIGADGHNSPVRSFAGIDTFGWDYNQFGVVATMNIRPSTDLENETAYQRFLPSGTIAILPLTDKLSSLVWALPTKIAARVSKLPAEELTQYVQCALHNPWEDVQYLLNNDLSISDLDMEIKWGQARGGSTTSVQPPTILSVRQGSVASFPLRLKHAESYVKDRVALVGDAAHTIHPLAGQGLNLGISDAHVLSDVILTAIQNGQDIGSPIILQKYFKDRYLENSAMIAAVEGIHRIFGTDNSTVVSVRKLGLDLFEGLGSVGLKERIMKYAMGYTP